jgi:asparagine synthase (glutamine-hydrolysing)
MCGIYGYYGFDQIDNKKIVNFLYKRGPDEHKKFNIDKITIGATRLAIRDVTNGSQPFFNKEFNLYSSLNGEIYNYSSLRKLIEKKGYKFKTNCDTEIIGPGYYFFKDKFFNMINGMFAIGIYDKKKKYFILSRDRFGIKPLYFYHTNEKFIYSSSAKSIYEQSWFEKKINNKSLISVLKKRYIENDEHIFENLLQVKRGSILKLYVDGGLRKNLFVKSNSFEKKLNINDEVEDFFEKGISNYNLADVDIGILLSSGVDSNLLSSYLSQKKTKNYSINFSNSKFSEKSKLIEYYKEKKIKFINYDHKKLIKSILPAVKSFDSPICDGVIFPMHELFRVIKKDKTKVIISGEGADEIFGGYYYLKIAKLIFFISKLRLNFLIKNIIKITNHRVLNYFFNYQGNLGNIGKKRFLKFLNIKKPKIRDFENLISVFDDQELERLLIHSIPILRSSNRNLMNISDLNSSTGLNWLSKYNCFKLDQISMNFGIEARVPYLDNSFYKIFFLLNKNKFFNTSKKILRNILFKKSNLKINKKIAFQNYTNLEKKRKIIKYAEKNFSDKNKIFKFIRFDEYKKILRNYKLSDEILLEKKFFSILILTIWFEKNL